MAEVFQGTPIIVNVAISGPDGRKVEYNVCGRDMNTVVDAVKASLKAIPDEDETPAPKVSHRKRRTKAEIAAVKDTAVENSNRRNEGREPVTTADAGDKTWP